MKFSIRHLLVAAASLLAANAMAGITGSKHDLKAAGWNASGQICIVCHTPHNAVASAGVLWNHTATTATYTLYASGTLNATTGQPGATSKLCLSCHDGTVAIDSFGGAGGTIMMAGNARVGVDLSNDHPIGFTYDAALASADGGLVDPSTLTGIPLYGGKLECGSCHNAHDNANAPFLRSTNAASALCLKCHNK